MTIVRWAAPLSLALGSVISSNAIAAQVNVDRHAECPVNLSGDIVEGDFDRVKNAIEATHLSDPHDVIDGTYSVCLNSPGGSYKEGRRIAEYIYSSGVGTRITSGSKCFSACATIFMAGRIRGEENDGIFRYLNANGVLGFHAPYLELPNSDTYTAQDAETAFDVANRMSSDFIIFGSAVSETSIAPWVKASLIAGILATPRDELLIVDTVEKAERWDISVYGIRKIDTTSKLALAQACVNFQNWTSDQNSREVNMEELAMHWRGYQTLPPSDDLFARIDTGGEVERFCDLRSIGGKGSDSYIQLCSKNEFNGVNYGDCPNYGIILDPLYTLPPSTPLRSIAGP